MILAESDVIKTMVDEIILSTEWLSTTEGDEIACVGVESLCGILLGAGIINKGQAQRIQEETE